MGSWRYEWPSGVTSFVSAATKDDAIFLLDQLGPAELSGLKSVEGGFFINMQPTKRGRWKLMVVDEDTEALGWKRGSRK